MDLINTNWTACRLSAVLNYLENNFRTRLIYGFCLSSPLTVFGIFNMLKIEQ